MRKNIAAGALGRLFGNGPDAKVVDIERQVIAVILDRTDGQDDDRLIVDAFLEFGPGVVLV